MNIEHHETVVWFKPSMHPAANQERLCPDEQGKKSTTHPHTGDTLFAKDTEPEPVSPVELAEGQDASFLIDYMPAYFTGCVVYGSPVDDRVHKTGFMYAVYGGKHIVSDIFSVPPEKPPSGLYIEKINGVNGNYAY